MLNKDIKKKIDDARDTLVGVLPLPTDQIELITIALIYKFMDDQDEELRQVGLNVKFFTSGLKEFSWQQLMSNQLSADARVTKFINGIEAIQNAKHIPALFRDIFLNAFLKFRDAKVLQRFLDLINGFKYDHSEDLGNAFEYLLKTMGAQGDNGQFRTPRNIIDFIVEVVDPSKDETILDPACGTGGFLVSAFKHLLRTNTTGYENYRLSLKNYKIEGIPINWGDKLSSTERSGIEKNIVGYDNTPLMVRLAMVNLYLHHFGNPKIHTYNTLTLETRWKEKYDCILANPPFMTPKGGIAPHDKFRIPANRTEILFASYILQHLNPDGKAGFVVPEGIIFQSSGDYVSLRIWMIYEAGLWAVVSLPAQIFQPYSGVKTSIVFIDKEIARKRKEILLVKIDNDGFSLNTNRTDIKANDLPDALEWMELSKSNLEQFVKEINTKKENQFTKKLRFLHRDEFARLDIYKSTSSAYSFCKKQYEKILKAKEEFETKLLEDPNNEVKTKEKYEKQLADFYKQTGINFLPDEEDKLKEWFESNIKDAAIEYGVNLNNIKKLTKELLDFIDSQREYILSFEQYSGEISNNLSEFPMVNVNEAFLVNAISINPNEVYGENEFTYIDISSVENGTGEIHFDNYIKGNEAPSRARRAIKNGDILLSTVRPNLKAFAYLNNIPHNCIASTGFAVLTPTDKVIGKYFFHLLFLEDLQKQMIGKMGKGSYPSINQTDVENLSFPLPSIEIQQRIADELEHYQKIVDGCNQLTENYKPNFDYDESWDLVSLQQVCDVRDGTHESPKYVAEGYPFITSKNLINGEIDFSTATFISKVDFEKYNFRSNVEDGDLLMGMIGTIGNPVVVKKDREFAIKNVALIKFSKDSPINNHFLKFYFESDAFKKLVIEKSSGSTQKFISLSFIRSLPIPIPPMGKQLEIVNEIHSELEVMKGAQHLKNKMQEKIKSVINKVWGK